MVVLLLLVAGGGALPVADPEHGPVDGAGAGPLDAALALAPWADGTTAAALDVPPSLALGAAPERGQVKEPHPRRHDGEDGEDQVRVHGCSPVPAAGRAFGVSLSVTAVVPGGVALGVPRGGATLVALGDAFAPDAAGEPLAVLVLAGLVAVLLLCICQHPHGVLKALPRRRRPAAATAQVSAGHAVAAGDGGSGAAL
jgi:hypothetical protein